MCLFTLLKTFVCRIWRVVKDHFRRWIYKFTVVLVVQVKPQSKDNYLKATTLLYGYAVQVVPWLAYLVWPFKWKLLNITFLWCCLLYCAWWFSLFQIFESVDKILWCVHSSKSYWVVLTCGAVWRCTRKF